jgi:CDP-6-deoxy-D-xylo-4-hexulose-3-dehydrase
MRKKILDLVKEYSLLDASEKEEEKFSPGDRISYASRVYDFRERVNLVDSALTFWLTAGEYAARFEKGLADFLGANYVALVNSGSSANLLAFMTLTSPLLGARRILPGDEVITVAAGFPTTVAPIVQYGAVPVFVDVTIPEYNVDVKQLQNALTQKTKAVMLAHTLGNPFDLQAIKSFCDENDLWLIEDNCDALGSQYQIDGIWKYTGTIGDIGTFSFYPPHHITMGEGGAVCTNDVLLHKIICSMRDWGRDCICLPGTDNLCGHRFDTCYGELPRGYDHKYVYSHFGYNLKATDMQAAVGVAQLEKLPDFIAKRRHNFAILQEGLADLSDELILPAATAKSEPSWFGFILTVKNGRDSLALAQHLERNNIQTRRLFAGNLTKHPCFDDLRVRKIESFRIAGELLNTDRIMKDSFWVGVYPGMNNKMVNHVVEIIKEYFIKGLTE